MQVLVATATDSAPAQQVGRELVATLRSGLSSDGMPGRVDLVEPYGVGSLSQYDAVVLGSPLHLDRWLRAAHDFALTHHDALRDRPLWLFSSGPVETGPGIDGSVGPREIRELAVALGARDHRVFDHGDERDLDAVRAYGRQIVAALRPSEGR